MNCVDCPYIEKELNNLLASEKRLHNSFTEKEILLYTAEMCWCDKVGGRIYKMGRCEECSNDDCCKNIPSPVKKNLYRRNMRDKRVRREKHNRKLQRLYKINNWFPSIVVDRSVVSVWARGSWNEIRIGKPSYKRIYRSNNGKCGGSRYNKKMSHRKIRRYKGELPRRGNGSNKLYDYWWEIY